MIKLKDNEGSPNVQFIINGQTYELKRNTEYIFDAKLYQFTFYRPKNEIIYKFKIDSFCFDDLMPYNKKQKDNLYVHQMSKTSNNKKQNFNIDKINGLINNNNNELIKYGNDLYYSNKIEIEEEKERNIAQDRNNFFLESLNEGVNKESAQESSKDNVKFNNNI